MSNQRKAKATFRLIEFDAFDRVNPWHSLHKYAQYILHVSCRYCSYSKGTHANLRTIFRHIYARGICSWWAGGTAGSDRLTGTDQYGRELAALCKHILLLFLSICNFIALRGRLHSAEIFTGIRGSAIRLGLTQDSECTA